MSNENDNYWYALKNGFMEYIKDKNVQSCYFKEYSRTMDLLMGYAADNNFISYSPEVGFAFVEYEKKQGYRGSTTVDRRRKVLKQLNEYLYGQVFWHRAPRNLNEYLKSEPPPQCPEQFAEGFEQFLKRIDNEGLKEVTVNIYRTFCTKMLLDFANQGAKEWCDIQAQTVTTAFLRSADKTNFPVYARRFFRYLVDVGLVAADYSGVLTTPTRKKTIPSVYSETEIQQFLDCVETGNPHNKRDYAIALLAVRLGLRVSDIRNLQFENVDFEKARVQFIQLKTLVPHQISLPTEVADALYDYIDNGREKSDESYIFLNGYARPLSRQAIRRMVQRNFKKTDIHFGHRRCGPHSLRMTFASQLIAEGVPYDAVRVLLGQSDRNSTRYYVEFALERLRTCALEVPSARGRLEEYLTNMGEV